MLNCFSPWSFSSVSQSLSRACRVVQTPGPLLPWDCMRMGPQEACRAAALHPGWAPLTTQCSEACRARRGRVVSSSTGLQEKKYLHLKTSVGPGGASHSRPFLSCSATDSANGHQTLLWTLRAAVRRVWSVHPDDHRGARRVQAVVTADQEQISAAVLAPHQPGECRPGSDRQDSPGARVQRPTSDGWQVPKRTRVV